MELLTTAEVGGLLRVSQETVRAMLARGDLEGFKAGRVVRVRKDSVERLLNEPAEATRR